MFTNVFDFLINTVLVNVFKTLEALWGFLSYKIPLKGIVNFFIKIWDFFSKDGVPEILQELANSDISILTLVGGSALVIVLILVIWKKIVPLL